MPLRSFAYDAFEALNDLPQIAHLPLLAILADCQVYEHGDVRIPPVLGEKRQLTHNPGSVFRILDENAANSCIEG